MLLKDNFLRFRKSSSAASVDNKRGEYSCTCFHRLQISKEINDVKHDICIIPPSNYSRWLRHCERALLFYK